ncbi:MAG TPA: hypothetical protein VF529_17470 [Solirubrobacteraceae bacterium]
MRRLAPAATCCAALFIAAGCGSPARDATGQSACPRPSNAGFEVDGGRAQSLRCSGLPRRLAPQGAEATVWVLGTRRYLVVWRADRSSGVAVWRRTGGAWERLLDHRRPFRDSYSLSIHDVTADGRLDVLVNELNGSGACGERVAFRVEPARVTPLFRRDGVCEVESELRDGLLWFREAIGDCPYARDLSPHCYGGVRLTIRGWNGDDVVVEQTIVRCLRSRLDPARGCRAP